TLVALGVSAASGYSLFHPLSGDSSSLYFESAVVIVSLVKIGRYLEDRARVGAAAAIKSLLALRPQIATVIDADGSEKKVLIESLEVGQIFLTKPGEQIATDG